MVTLFKFRDQVDLILTDPPYNTGNDFRYNDRWDDDPNDPELGPLVSLDDGSPVACDLGQLSTMQRNEWPTGLAIEPRRLCGKPATLASRPRSFTLL